MSRHPTGDGVDRESNSDPPLPEAGGELRHGVLGLGDGLLRYGNSAT